MSNDRVELKALKNFRKIHIELNDYVKLATIGIDYLRKSTEDKDLLAHRISNLIVDAGERWLAWHYPVPHESLIKVRKEITASAIIRVYSAFEVFSDEIIGLTTLNPKAEEFTEEENLKRIPFLFKKNSWSTDEISYILPVYNFYTTCRNCIAHRMGKASQLLKKQLASNEFKTSIENWPTVKKDRKLSPSPSIDDDGFIVFYPHHALTYSDVCYRLTTVINKNLARDLGLEYFLKKVVKRHLLNQEQLNGHAGKDVYAYLRRHLEADYNFETAKDSQMREILENNGLRSKCLTKYKLLTK